MDRPPVCVLCRRRPADPVFRPFCSKRCQMADLGRWLTGAYRVPLDAGDPVETPADEPDDPGQPDTDPS